MATQFAINAANVKMRFPTFSQTPDALVEFAIEEANVRCDPLLLGDFYLPAFLYLTAHVLTRAIQSLEGGVGMPLRSISVGGEISYSYETPDQPKLSDPSDLTTTAFGVRFLELVTMQVPAVAII
jgi:Protein of unknown function (DUF4054)